MISSLFNGYIINDSAGLAARVNRRDTLAKRLDVPDPVDDIPNQTSDDRRLLMHKASIKLERFLSKYRSVFSELLNFLLKNSFIWKTPSCPYIS